jgi:hypothetical protein
MRPAGARAVVCLGFLGFLGASLLVAASCQGGGGALPALLGALLSAVFLWACDGDRRLPRGETTQEPKRDAGAAPDVGAPVAVDAAPDVGAPVAVDAAPDAGAPVAMDAAPDIGMPIPMDAAPEALADAGSDSTVPDARDAGAVDTGHWESCCLNGRFGSCWCPYGPPGFGTCNFAQGIISCGGETCVRAPASCPSDGGVDAVSEAGIPADALVPPDAGSPPDASADTAADGGVSFWEQCCVDGRISSCLCTSSSIMFPCNFALTYVVCNDGTCVPRFLPDAGVGSCPPPGGDGGSGGDAQADAVSQP